MRLALQGAQLQRGEARKRPFGTRSNPTHWFTRDTKYLLRNMVAGMAETVRGGNLLMAMATLACFVLLAHARMPDGGTPFAVAAFVAQLISGVHAPFAFVGVVIGALTQWTPTAWSVWWQAPACAALWMSYPFWRGRVPQQATWRAALAAALMLLVPLPFSAPVGWEARVQCLLNALVAGSTTPVFAQCFQLLRRRPRPLRSDERLCGLLALCVLTLGGLPWHIGPCSIGMCLAVGITALLAQAGGASAGLLGGAAIGFAMSVGGAPTQVAVMLGGGGALAGMLGSHKRLTTAGSFLLGAVASALILRDDVLRWFPLEALLAGLILFLVLPQRLRAPALRFAASAGEEGALRPEGVGTFTAHMLAERAQSMRALLAALPAPMGYAMDLNDRLDRLADKHCQGCARWDICWRANVADTAQVMGSLLEIADERDIAPEDITNTVQLIGCARADRAPHSIDALLQEEQRALVIQARQAEARALAGIQLEGLAQCMLGVSTALRKDTAFLPALQRRVQRTLTQDNLPAEVVTVTRVAGKVEVLLEGSSLEDLYSIREQVSRAVGVAMRPRIADNPEVTELVYEQESALDGEVGVARCTKYGEEVAGDGFMALRLSGGRQLLAISDGMGSGTRAQQESHATLALLRQCLGAGYTRAQALMAVNGLLLACAGEDMFATMDLCMVDLHNGEVAFEKLGACTSYVIHGDTCRAIAGETLPLGILHNVRPRSHRLRLQEGDVVVMVSDGVADAFPNGDEGIMRALAGMRTLPAQHIADALLKRALVQQGGRALDDMTVLCVRLMRQADLVMALDQREEKTGGRSNRRAAAG